MSKLDEETTMTQHVYARIAGFGLVVMPRAPFRARHADDPAMAIDVEHDSPQGRLFARVIPDNGGYQSKIDQHTESLNDVLDVEAGPDAHDWRIETSVFTCCWPRGYLLCSNNFPEDPGPFDLVGIHNELIYIQKPKTMPDVETMCGPNQKILNVQRHAESEWIELEYEHEGTPWRQRHEVVTLLGQRFAVTMQTPLSFARDAVDVAREIATSIRSNESGASA